VLMKNKEKAQRERAANRRRVSDANINSPHATLTDPAIPEKGRWATFSPD
jgi:hypothetical protein